LGPWTKVANILSVEIVSTMHELKVLYETAVKQSKVIILLYEIEVK
jgi:hypothetical protein